MHALRGKEYVEWDNPYDVGMTGLIGFSSGYYAMLDCDVLLMLGTDFPYRQFYPRGASVRIAQIDLRPEQIGRRAPVDLGVVGDVKATLAALLPLLKEKRDETHLAQARSTTPRPARRLMTWRSASRASGSIHPQQVAKAISDQAATDAVFTCDVGLPTVWAARYLAMNGKRRLIGSFWHGSMANAMAQAIGAQTAFPSRQVISLSGDGGFSMLMGDFLSLTQLSLPVKVVVFNNGALGFIELEQMSTGFLDDRHRVLRIRILPRWPRPSVCAAFGSKSRPKSRRALPQRSRTPVRCWSTPSSTGPSSPCRRPLRRDGERLHALHGEGRDERRGDEIVDLAKSESLALEHTRQVEPLIPAQAGIQGRVQQLGPRFRGDERNEGGRSKSIGCGSNGRFRGGDGTYSCRGCSSPSPSRSTSSIRPSRSGWRHG